MLKELLLKRTAPRETKTIEYNGQKLTVPTESEILRIKAFLIISRNATRDYIDFVALSDHLEFKRTQETLKDFYKKSPNFMGAYPILAGETFMRLSKIFILL